MRTINHSKPFYSMSMKILACCLATAWLMSGCAAHRPTQTRQPVAALAAIPHETSATNQTIKICTFNIQNFGKTKIGRPDTLKTLVDIVHRFDVVAIQEVSDSTGVAMKQFATALNQDGFNYALVVSPRTGRQPNDKSSQEQYAFAFNRKTVEQVGTALLYNDEKDNFQREPYVGRFKVRGGNFNFVLITIHAQPERAVEEIGALHQVNQWAQKMFPDEDDFITVGDYNASCGYAQPADLRKLELYGDSYVWVVPDDADTNLAASRCAYDRIVLTKRVTGDYTGKWEVYRPFTDKNISDHWPVWAEFYTNRDTR